MESEEEDEMGYLIHVWGQVGRSVRRLRSLRRESSALMLMLDASYKEGAEVQ